VSGSRSALRWMSGLNLRRTGLFPGSPPAQGSRVRLGRAWERPGTPSGGPNPRMQAESPSDSPKAKLRVTDYDADSNRRLPPRPWPAP
jgi:hypothetical protein